MKILDALILNRKFETQVIVDGFESFIWTDRYRTPGDFELYMPVSDLIMPYALEQNYVWQKNSDRLMIIEDIYIDTDAEIGPHITLSGRSLESLLERRVVADRTIISGNLQNGIKKLLDENAISPSDPSRVIPGLRFVESKESNVTKLTCELNLLGETLLEVIEGQCELNDLGFRIVFNEDLGTFDFSLYYGEDRSYDQERNPWVVFSPNYDNLLSSQYYSSSRELKTAAVAAGNISYEYGQQIVMVDAKPTLSGLDRREMFVDGSDIEMPDPQVDEDAIRESMEQYEDITEAEIQAAIDAAWEHAISIANAGYQQQLLEKGKEEVSRTFTTETFSGEIEAVRQYVYNRDFFLGDVVQIRDEYGREASSRITELIMSHDVNGESLIPTFSTLLGGANRGDIID